MEKNPIKLAELNRQAFLQGKFDEVQANLFKSGLTIGEISQVLQVLTGQFHSVKIGEVKEEPKEIKEVKK